VITVWHDFGQTTCAGRTWPLRRVKLRLDTILRIIPPETIGKRVG